MAYDSDDYTRLGAKTKLIRNVEENRRIAAAFPGINDEVQKELASQRMATARAAKTAKTGTNGPVRRLGRKPGSKNKAKLPVQTQERTDAVNGTDDLV